MDIVEFDFTFRNLVVPRLDKVAVTWRVSKLGNMEWLRFQISAGNKGRLERFLESKDLIGQSDLCLRRKKPRL